VLITPYTRLQGDQLHGHHPEVLAQVWVRLDVISGRLPGAPYETVVDGLDMTGHAPGLVTGYFRSSRGDWLAVVNYQIPYADGRTPKVQVVDQLVQKAALQRRDPRDGT
jgi:hypothetical protein